VVKSIEIGNDGYMVDAAEGESGLLVTRGRNLMSGYVGNASATSKALHEASDGKYPWYVNFGDVCFTLTNPDDGERDIYWQSRESSLLIKGGANYSYDQINEELTKFVTQEYGFSSDEFALAVIGQRLRSEHEDECCVTVQLPERTSKSARDTFKASFVQRAKQCVGKGSRPDFVRLGEIPRNFKGAVQVKELVARWKATKGKDDDKISGSSKSSPSDLRDAKQSPSSIVTACVLLVATVTVAAILVRHKSKNGL
jgi:acyl-CoA synthetase (AMP-forming)/AMP-acid ligase II